MALAADRDLDSASRATDSVYWIEVDADAAPGQPGLGSPRCGPHAARAALRRIPLRADLGHAVHRPAAEVRLHQGPARACRRETLRWVALRLPTR